MVNLTEEEASILYTIFLKHESLVRWGQLPKLNVSKGLMSQIENKLFSGALLYEELNKGTREWEHHD